MLNKKLLFRLPKVTRLTKHSYTKGSTKVGITLQATKNLNMRSKTN